MRPVPSTMRAPREALPAAIEARRGHVFNDRKGESRKTAFGDVNPASSEA